jgi:uncharacterized CHY-type Zn-finger protein
MYYLYIMLPIMNKTNLLLKGQLIDNQTRCVHYHSNLDVIAIKFKCCDTYYPCFSCHEVETNHPTKIWQKADFDQLAILCGVCRHELTIHQYLASDSICPFCQAAFNPKCANHYQLYFDL